MRKVILNFHGLGTPARALEPGEAPYWVAPELLETALDIADRLAGEVQVDITFDDGNASDLELGAPILEAHGRSATFFVLADRIDMSGSLSTGDIRALVAAGHRIGSHGSAHVSWKGQDPSGLDHELGREVRDRIAEAAGAPVTEAAIPFGTYNARVLRALRNHGYEMAYSSDGGAWRDGQFPCPRTSVRDGMDAADIEALLLGREPFRARLRRPLARVFKKVL